MHCATEHLLAATTSLDLTGILADEAEGEDPPAEAVVEGLVGHSVLSTDGLTSLVLVGGAEAVAEGALTLIKGSLGGGHQVAGNQPANDAGGDIRQATEQ